MRASTTSAKALRRSVQRRATLLARGPAGAAISTARSLYGAVRYLVHHDADVSNMHPDSMNAHWMQLQEEYT